MLEVKGWMEGLRLLKLWREKEGAGPFNTRQESTPQLTLLFGCECAI